MGSAEKRIGEGGHLSGAPGQKSKKRGMVDKQKQSSRVAREAYGWIRPEGFAA